MTIDDTQCCDDTVCKQRFFLSLFCLMFNPFWDDMCQWKTHIFLFVWHFLGRIMFNPFLNKGAHAELTKITPSLKTGWHHTNHGPMLHGLMLTNCKHNRFFLKQIIALWVRLSSEINFRNLRFQLSQLMPRQSWDHYPLLRSVVRSSSAFRSSNSWSWDVGAGGDVMSLIKINHLTNNPDQEMSVFKIKYPVC